MFLLKLVIRYAVFLFLLYTIINYLTGIFIPKEELYYQSSSAPYYEKENSMDVVFVGSSHMELAVDPNIVWQEQGISSIDYIIPGLDLNNTYYMLNEIVKHQSPKVLVIDVFRIFNPENQMAQANRMANVFPLSANKLEMIHNNKELNTFSKRMDYYFPLYLYHSRKLQKHDFTYVYDNWQRGHGIFFEQVKENFTPLEITEKMPLDSAEQAIIQRIINFGKQKRIELLFIKTPHLKADVTLHKKWNTIEEIAAANKIPFYNFNKPSLYNEVGFSYMEDTWDDESHNGHLNHHGAIKLSVFIGKKLRELYHITDKRNNDAYRFLHAYLAHYKEKINEMNPFLKPSKGNRLESGSKLLLTEYLISDDHRFRLILQKDGNLVLYKGLKEAIWASNTTGKAAVECEMQTDGNLVLYNKEREPVWSSNTFNKPQSYLSLQNDANLVIYNQGNAIWATDTWKNQ